MKSYEYTLVAFSLVWALVAVIVLLVMKRRADRNLEHQRIKQAASQAVLIYRNKMSSGRARGKIGGASNCLFIGVSQDALYVLLPDIFAGMAEKYDLEHIIRKSAIRSITRGKVLFGPVSYAVSYTDDSGRNHEIILFPRHIDEFERALFADGTVGRDMVRFGTSVDNVLIAAAVIAVIFIVTAVIIFMLFSADAGG